MKDLTTTSYAILGLLSFRSWSTYALAKQMERSLRFIWPRAESKLYEEPKNLVAHGLARVERASSGKRVRRVYTITDEGRAALRRWLADPGAGPLLEFEGMLKVFFADQSGTEALLTTLQRIAEQAEGNLRFGAALAQEYLDGVGPYPERLQVMYLVFQFLWDYLAMLAHWAHWAEDEVHTWSDVAASPEKSAAALAVFRRAVERIRSYADEDGPDQSE